MTASEFSNKNNSLVRKEAALPIYKSLFAQKLTRYNKKQEFM